MMSLRTPDYLVDLSTDCGKLKLTSNHGYVVAPQKIMRCFRLTDFEKLLLLDLLSFMGNKEYAFPSHKYLAIRHGKKSVTSIKETLNALYDKGFLKWSKGGGDLGTNHYKITDLFFNPYIVMSEATYYFIDCLLYEYRSILSYEKLYGSVQAFINVSKTVEGTESDKYSIYLKHLKNFPKDRDNYTFYQNYLANLLYFIEESNGVTLDKIEPYSLVREHFRANHKNFYNEDGVEESKIYEMISDPESESEIESEEDIEEYKLYCAKQAMHCNLAANYIYSLKDLEVVDEYLKMFEWNGYTSIYDGGKLLFPKTEVESDGDIAFEIEIKRLREDLIGFICGIKENGLSGEMKKSYKCPI
jgi:hypothetical protein